MPILEHDEAIRQYYEEVKDKYPEIDFERFRIICRSPFQYIKRCIQSVTMPIIKIKFLGTFRVYPTKVKRSLLALESVKDRIDPIKYNERKEFLTNYLKLLEDAKNPETPQEIEIIED